MPSQYPLDALGGADACRRLSTAFYARVAKDPLLRPLFPGKTFTCAIEEFAAFLIQFLGGPTGQTQRRWWVSLHESHQRFRIGPAERAAWLKHMAAALNDAAIAEPMREHLFELFRHASAYVRDPQSESAPQGPPELANRWQAQTTLDKVATAIDNGDHQAAIELAGNPSIDLLSTSARMGVLSRMIRSRNPSLRAHVRAALTANPALVAERFAGRTLLHDAAAVGDLSTLEFLLKRNADPDVPDAGEHTPLYYAANEGGDPAVVHALAKSGADVNANRGAKRCTPLHMAARRGFVAAAEALLDCGAMIEARDSLGDTPLRRAVNLNQTELATLLIARGANLKSVGSKRLTPLEAARSAAMKTLLGSAARS